MIKLSQSFLSLLLLLISIVSVGQNLWPEKEWPISTPEKEKLITDSLQSFETDINNGQYGFVDGMFITRNGKQVWQKTWKLDYGKIYGDSVYAVGALNAHDPGGPYNYYNPWWHPFYRRGDLHTLQSVTKTITSVVIGVAIARHEFPGLSTPVLSFFDTASVKNIDERKKRMTVEHLLTMSAGFNWDETLHYNDPQNDCSQMEASFDWVQYVINKPMQYEPGQVFAYNSGASQLLSYLFKKATGSDIEEFAARQLFAPLGITDYFWKRTPTGLADTEGGLYLRTSDLAKIYYLYLQEGNWNGKQLVTAEWVRSSVNPFITVGNGVKYGYKWWLFEYGKGKWAWCGSGFGGQWPVIIPEYNIVAVFNGWNVIDGKPSLGVRTIIGRLVNAVVD